MAGVGAAPGAHPDHGWLTAVGLRVEEGVWPLHPEDDRDVGLQGTEHLVEGARPAVGADAVTPGDWSVLAVDQSDVAEVPVDLADGVDCRAAVGVRISPGVLQLRLIPGPLRIIAVLVEDGLNPL